MPTILIVDDSMFIRNRVRQALVSAGYGVEEAVNGKQALEKCGSGSYACVVTDLVMPELDGIGLLENLAAQSHKIPAIVLSADIQKSTRERCEQLGARTFLNKPSTAEEITEAIALALAAQ